ncbi:MAG: HAD family hydrolase [Candidatus Bathyarchaeota archaeon]|nr:HAD family hydrolase [Candidatus Bathyarchaeota archaeon]
MSRNCAFKLDRARNYLDMSNVKLKVKAILLDLDGTIVDSRFAYLEAARIALQALGQPPLEPLMALQIPKRLEQNQSIDDLTGGDTAQFLEIYLKTFYRIAHLATKPIPNIHAALEALQQKAKLALVTMRNTPSTAIAKELQNFNLAQYFPHIVTARDTTKPKPSPEALMKALQALNVKTCDCLIAGDSVIDIKAGKAAGAKTAAVTSGLYSRLELATLHPDLILEDATKLPSFIE